MKHFQTKDNDPAFPNAMYAGPDDHAYVDGITIRQYFSIKAMQGLLANAGSDVRELGYETYVAEDAVKCADALIKELNKT